MQRKAQWWFRHSRYTTDKDSSLGTHWTQREVSTGCLFSLFRGSRSSFNKAVWGSLSTVAVILQKWGKVQRPRDSLASILPKWGLDIMCAIREAKVEDQNIHLYHIEYQTWTAGKPRIYQTPGINRFSCLPTEAELLWPSSNNCSSLYPVMIVTLYVAEWVTRQSYPL